MGSCNWSIVIILQLNHFNAYKNTIFIYFIGKPYNKPRRQFLAPPKLRLCGDKQICFPIIILGRLELRTQYFASVEILPIVTQQWSTTSPEQIEVMKLEG